MSKKIVVIGSSNVDMIMKMDRLPKVGETITNAIFMQVFGGKGANQAVSAARAGGEVVFINAVGNDPYSKRMVKNFKEDGIDTRYILKKKKEVSGHALVMVGNEGKNYLSVAPGANYSLTPKHIKKVDMALQDAAIILMQYEIPESTISYVIDYAFEKKISVIWNFAPAQNLDREYLKKVKILIVNQTEAGFLAEMEIGNKEKAETAAKKLLLLGTKLVIITLGASGVIYASANETGYLPAFRVEAVDTTAAGDVFCGSFAVAHVEGRPLKEAIAFASAASALSVTKMGAQPSVAYRREIDHFLDGKKI